MFSEFVNSVSSIMLDLGYIWIFFMMVLESSFFPFPSEVAMIPAWYFVWAWKMNIFLAFLAWTFWALVWAMINYFLWYFLWEKVILSLIRKYWKYFFIKEEWYNKTKKYFIENWSLATFTGRLIPVIRQLISVPAWIFKMNLKKFLFFTILWAWIWNLILIWIWYFIWKIIWPVENISLILDKAKPYLKEFSIYWIIFVVVLVIIYFLLKKRKNQKI